MLRRAWLFQFRALGAVASWLGLIGDANGTGDLLFTLPCLGLIFGILPVRWFPVVAPAQVILAATTIALIQRRALSSGWLFPAFLGMTLLLNLALWLRGRAAQPRHPDTERGACGDGTSA